MRAPLPPAAMFDMYGPPVPEHTLNEVVARMAAGRPDLPPLGLRHIRGIVPAGPATQVDSELPMHILLIISDISFARTHARMNARTNARAHTHRLCP